MSSSSRFLYVSAGVPEAVVAAVPRVGLPPPGDHTRLPDHVARPRRGQVRHEELHRLGALRRDPLRRGESNLYMYFIMCIIRQDRLDHVIILLYSINPGMRNTPQSSRRAEVYFT